MKHIIHNFPHSKSGDIRVIMVKLIKGVQHCYTIPKIIHRTPPAERSPKKKGKTRRKASFESALAKIAIERGGTITDIKK